MILILPLALLAAAPLQRGVNMDHVFNPYDESKEPYSAEDYGEIDKALRLSEFQSLKKAGFDFIRLNLGLRPFRDPRPPFRIREEGFSRLDKALDLAAGAGLSVIVDCHQIPVPRLVNNKAERKAFIDFWRFLASRYVQRPSTVLYGVLNEPRVEKAKAWRSFTQDWISAIRLLDRERRLVVSGGGWGSLEELMDAGTYSDANLIYDFHFYKPFAFTHQGADWSDDVESLLHNIHFPYRAEEMKAPREEALKKGWETWPMDDYPQTPDAAGLEGEISKVAEWAASNKVSLLCGEFGAIDKGPLDDRARWLSDMRAILEKKHIAWAVWAFHAGFDVFDPLGQPVPSLVKALIP